MEFGIRVSAGQSETLAGGCGGASLPVTKALPPLPYVFFPLFSESPFNAREQAVTG